MQQVNTVAVPRRTAVQSHISINSFNQMTCLCLKDELQLRYSWRAKHFLQMLLLKHVYFCSLQIRVLRKRLQSSDLAFGMYRIPGSAGYPAIFWTIRQHPESGRRNLTKLHIMSISQNVPWRCQLLNAAVDAACTLHSSRNQFSLICCILWINTLLSISVILNCMFVYKVTDNRHFT